MIQFSPIEFWEFSTNLASATVCLVMAAVLLFFRTEHSLRLVGYRRVRVYIALSALSVVVLDAAIIGLMLNDRDFRVLDAMFVPVMYYTQLHLTTVAMLLLLRSPRVRGYVRLWLVVPVIVLMLLHHACYVVTTGHFADYDSYVNYLMTPLARALSMAAFVVIVVELSYYILRMILELRRYEQGIDNYFSGNAAYEAKQLSLIMRCLVVYFIFAGLDFIWGSMLSGEAFRVVNLVLVSINTTVFVVATITVLNLQRAYSRVAPAFEMRDRTEAQAVQAAQTIKPSQPTESGSLITPRVNQWSHSPQKPYLREGLTLATVAEEMGISPRLLSAYINSLHQRNFNTWVNGLRMEEVKRLLAQRPTLTMSEIAFRTGFNDAPALTKVFKRLEGITPSSYRERIKSEVE